MHVCVRTARQRRQSECAGREWEQQWKKAEPEKGRTQRSAAQPPIGQSTAKHRNATAAINKTMTQSSENKLLKATTCVAVFVV